MKCTAIISEYNPYHNGHDFQNKMIKKGDISHFTLAVMSGNFTQRGEPAIFDKWLRAKLALLGGIDIVIELPTLFALQSAEGFASGGVAIANRLGIIDELCFGSESADIDALNAAAKIFTDEAPEYKNSLSGYLSQGISFPAARAGAMKMVSSNNTKILHQPNDILAVEYIKALMKSDSSIVPKAILRAGSAYHQETLAEEFPSAKAIRSLIYSGKINLQSYMENIRKAIPLSCLPFFTEVISDKKPLRSDDFFPLLLYKLRSMTTAQIASISGVSEGLEYRIKKASDTSGSFEELAFSIKSKRFTHSRITRILFCCLLDITNEKAKQANQYNDLYAHVLGFRRSALPLLSLMAKKSSIPVITRGTQLPQNMVSKTDILASDVYSILSADQKAGRDYTEKLIIL